MKLLLLAGLCAGLANADVSFVYSSFSSVGGLALNGNAAQAGSLLRLVPSVDTQSGTAYYATPVPLSGSTGFSTSFEFNISIDPTSTLGVTDGFAFLLQNSSANALGSGGQGLGYVGISPSVAVVFRGRAPVVIGVITGVVDPADLTIPFQPPGFASSSEGSFYNQNEYAWIDYDPSTKQLSVYMNTMDTKPGSAIMSTNVDVFGDLGSEAYVGFSAGNGGAFGNQDILNWSFASTAVPEPSALVLLLTALGMVGIMGILGRRMLQARR
jgi:hypothetical protein